MIIAISSPPPIDTSELANKIASEKNLKIIQDPAVALCKEYGFQTLYDMPDRLQGEIREALIRNHLEFVKENDNILLNFSVFEYLADWVRWFWQNTPSEKWEEISGIAAEAIDRYDEIYHVSQGTHKNYDGYVWFDKRNAKQINGVLAYLFAEMDVSDRIIKS